MTHKERLSRVGGVICTHSDWVHRGYAHTIKDFHHVQSLWEEEATQTYFPNNYQEPLYWWTEPQPKPKSLAENVYLSVPAIVFFFVCLLVCFKEHIWGSIPSKQIQKQEFHWHTNGFLFY